MSRRGGDGRGVPQTLTQTRGEPGNLFFDWSRSVEDPTQYVLVEAFADDDAGRGHVQSDHFKKATEDLPKALSRTPRIVSRQVDGSGWDTMGEMVVDEGDV